MSAHDDTSKRDERLTGDIHHHAEIIESGGQAVEWVVGLVAEGRTWDAYVALSHAGGVEEMRHNDCSAEILYGLAARARALR